MKIKNKAVSLCVSLAMALPLIAVPAQSASAAPGDNIARLSGNTYSASSSESGRGPALAFDGDRTSSNSRWAEQSQGLSAVAGEWLEAALVSAQPVTSAVIYFESMTKDSTGALKGTVTLQYSNNGTDWKTIDSKNSFTADEAASKTVTFTFDPVVAGYMRLYFPEAQFWLSVYEFELYWNGVNPPDVGTDLARLAGNTYSASSFDGANPIAGAFDGNRTSGRWAEGNTNAGQWLQVTFPKTRALSSAVIYFEALTKGLDNSHLEGVVDLQYSGDGSDWKTIQEKTFTTETNKTVEFDFAPMYAQYIRVYFPQSQFYLSVYSFELYWNGVEPSGGDTALLRAAVNQCQPVYTESVLSQYKMSAVNNYKNALTAAVIILQAANPPVQAEIDAALNALNSAVNSLEPNRVIFTNALKATPAEDWNELFNNLTSPGQDDWRAGDGMHSVPLTGVDAIGSGGPDTPTAWMFSDSYVSSFKDLSQSLLLNKLQMPNNVFADFMGIQPDKTKLSFVFGQGGNKAMLRNPPTPGDEGGTSNVVPEAYWVQDGIVIGNYLYVTSDHEDNSTLTTYGVSMVKFPILSNYQVDWAHYQWLGFKPLFNSATTFVTGILDNSQLSGVPSAKADGYVYCYGATVPGYAQRRVVVARTTKANFEDPEKWEFYTANGWQTGATANLGSVAGITPSNLLVSASTSVTYINSGIYSGKYLMTYTDGALGEKIGYMLADNPWGPFTNPTVCFVAPQMEEYQNELYQVDNPKAWYVTYNPTAHPHLSKAGQLLISYDCFVWNSNKSSNANWHQTETNEFYRERFFTLDLNKMAAVAPQNCVTLVSGGKPVAASSGANPANVTDGSDFTKWESSGNEPNKTLTIDLGRKQEVGRYIIKHGGLAIVNNSDITARNFLNTRRFQLQYSDDGANWKTAVDKEYNASFENDENFAPVIGRYFRLNIQQPTQGAMDKATIYEFQLYSPSHSIAVNNPFGAAVKLSADTAVYGDAVNFTVAQSGQTTQIGSVTLRSAAGNTLLQTLTPAWNGVYSFTMPNMDVVVSLAAADSGVISAQVADAKASYAAGKDDIHVQVTTVAGVTRLALYDAGGYRIGVTRQKVSPAGGNLIWDLWFKLGGAGSHVIQVKAGAEALIASDSSVTVAISE